MPSIDIYCNSAEILKRKESKIFIKFIFMFIIMCTLVLGIIFIEYPNEYCIEGVISNNKVVAYLTKESLMNLKGNTLKIKDIEMPYKIESITELEYSSNYEKYYLVNIIVEGEVIENEVVNMIIEDGNTNLYRDFIKKVWKGFN